MGTAAGSFDWIDAAFGRALVTDAFDGVASHLFTTRSLTLRGEHADRDWAALARAMTVAPERLFAPKQVHGHEVLVARKDAAAPISLNDLTRPHADIVITDDPGTAVAVQVADCVPLLFADRRTGAVAAAHAGWRGTAAHVAVHTVRAMAEHFGTRPGDLVVAIGPSIGACCYQVKADVLAAFESAGFAASSLAHWFSPDGDADHLLLDVPLANRHQLIAAGVSADRIARSGLCTACHPEHFFSYRRDGAGTGRLAAAIRPLPRR
jgi:YfiH family protein